MTSSTIIPVASGKGGTGKTMFTANTAMALAKNGYETILVDLDFGGANLYTFLGLTNSYPGIGDYLKTKRSKLEDYLISTDFENLKYIPGDTLNPFMANIPYVHKQKLIRNLKKLPAKYIFLDLGAGSTYNTLDLFGIANYGIIVTTCEHTALMNMFTFLKNFILRTIEREFSDNKSLKQHIRDLLKRPSSEYNFSIEAIEDHLLKAEPAIKTRWDTIFKTYRPRIVYNKGKKPDELSVLKRIDINLKTNLNLVVDHFGFIDNDPAVPKSIDARLPLFDNFPESLVARDINLIADRIIRLWDEPLHNTAEILYKKTKKINQAIVEPELVNH